MARTLLLCLALAYSGLGVAQVDCLKQQAKKLIGTREGPVNNRGPRVDSIIRYAGGVPGQPWCSYTIIYLFKKCGSVFPGVNGAAKSWARKEKAVGLVPVRNTDVFTVYNKALGRIGHVGMVYQVYPEERFFQSFEGNVNARGDRESHRSMAGCLIREYAVVNGFFRWAK